MRCLSNIVDLTFYYSQTAKMGKVLQRICCGIDQQTPNHIGYAGSLEIQPRVVLEYSLKH